MTIEESIKNFSNKEIYDASRDFFHTLGIPIDEISSTPIAVDDIFTTVNDSFKDVKNVYAIGMLNDAYFRENKSTLDITVKKDYQGILLFSIELSTLNPTRKTLADISRAFNKEYLYTPVVILFKYGNKLSLSNTQRQDYKINKEGEKTGKVIILRDVDIENPHRGHIDILEDMKITSKVDSYESLYQHWQKVFDVSLLNKKFYQELSNWYSYAIQEVKFPNQPNDTDKEAIDTHKSQNVIRLLTRFLFVWFIKEKGLIPTQLFDEKYIKSTLKDFNPKNMDGSLFGGQDKSSLYYKAILQNLLFASLNCPIKPLDKEDKRERGFRKKEHYGQNRDANFLMRYEDSFNNPQEFLALINEYVPFLNGGLFECLDDKINGVYIDGFSDNLPKEYQLIIPDYLFFGVEEHVDLSTWYGSKNKAFKNATVKGLIKILDSYKFTVAENTPIEEDVALDPELLGRVFENLLASYNPETKKTARKQTGSFYTPREIVSYMVDESLIAYLKTKLKDRVTINNLEDKLRTLCSYSDEQPFEDKSVISKLITALDELKALDPAVGSGAFPMGMLQKMVHILSKLDPDNKHWKELQKQKAQKDSSEAFEKEDKEQRAKLLDEINNAFDETVNNPDYARKLYIIENSIYGVDIQSIAIQISKLRFFISLVIEQNIDKSKPNFGIRPLPNLETKFISANTLIGIKKDRGNLFNDNNIKELEKELKKIRHKLFNAKTPRTKRNLREKDKELREKIAEKLEQNGLGNDSAKLLANWDPYSQNESSPFFDMEWMFGIQNGFDVVIGNPPYVVGKFSQQEIKYFKSEYNSAIYQINLYMLFVEKSHFLTKKEKGFVSLIIPNTWLVNKLVKPFRKMMVENFNLYKIVDCTKEYVFDATVLPVIFFSKNLSNQDIKIDILEYKNNNFFHKSTLTKDILLQFNNLIINYQISQQEIPISEQIQRNSEKLSKIATIAFGVKFYQKGKGVPKQTVDIVKNHTFTHNNKINNSCKLILEGKNIERFKIINPKKYIEYGKWLAEPRTKDMFEGNRIVLRRIVGDKRLIANSIYGDYCNNSLLHTIKLKSNQISIEYILGILNSKLMGWFFIKYFARDEKTFPEIRIHELEFLPIKINKNYNIIIILVQILKDNLLKSSFNLFDKILDALVFELYFEKHMNEKEINILVYVNNDMNKILQDKKFEDLNKEQREQLIQKLYDKWTHPDNEVRNRIKLFAVRSPDILKPILES